MEKFILFSVVLILPFFPVAAGDAWALEGHNGHDKGSHKLAEERIGHDRTGQGQDNEKPAECCIEPLEVPDISPVMRTDGVVDLNNKTCLVSGKAVNGGRFYEHEGVNIGFCSKVCIQDFKKDPNRYALSMDVIHEAMGHSGHAH